MWKELTATTKPHLSGEDISTQQRIPGCGAFCHEIPQGMMCWRVLLGKVNTQREAAWKVGDVSQHHSVYLSDKEFTTPDSWQQSQLFLELL